MVKKGNIPWNKGRKMSEEYCRINSESHKGQKAWNKGVKGEGNSMYGNHHSKETKEKISKALKGREFTEEHKENLSNSRKGMFYGEDNPMYGRTGVNSPLYGRKHSKETKEKMRISALNSWKDKERKRLASIRLSGSNNPSWNPNREEVMAPYGINYFSINVRLRKRILQNDRDLLTGDKIDFSNRNYAFHHIDYNKSNDDIDNMCFLTKLNHNRITNSRKNKLKSKNYKITLQNNLNLLKQGKIPDIWTEENKKIFFREINEQIKLDNFIEEQILEVND